MATIRHNTMTQEGSSKMLHKSRNEYRLGFLLLLILTRFLNGEIATVVARVTMIQPTGQVLIARAHLMLVLHLLNQLGLPSNYI